MAMNPTGRIRVGIGGWTYAPWRDTFYPADLPQKRELEYASRRLTVIEINGTFYRTQTPASFAKWRDETPDDFVFTVKAPRYATHRAILAEAGPAIERFMASGVLDLREKLGPIVWQFAPTKRYQQEDFERFVQLLPRDHRLRHVLEVRHESFLCAEFIEQARRHNVGTVYTDSDRYPSYADVTSDFVYARLMRSDAAQPTGYPENALDEWARRVSAWSRGEQPADLPTIVKHAPPPKRRDVYIFFINGAKERAPAAATALLARL
ncbi:MAG: DUF72 domain-containing protein [Rhodospirillaceae bacterium]